MKVRLCVALLACATATAPAADEKKTEPPRIIAVTPLRVIAGEKQTVRLRGVKLKDVTEIRATPAVTATVKEKKDASLPAGLEAKEVGDQEIAVELTVPADFAAKTVSLDAITPAGSTGPRELPVIVKDSAAREKEPNNGFREAMSWDGAQPMDGRIDADKDVDVFRLPGRAGKALTIRITAAAAGSLLDPVLALYDAAGSLLSTADDTAENRDARLSFAPKTDGPLCLVVSDAHDRGGAWHEYRLEMETPP